MASFKTTDTGTRPCSKTQTANGLRWSLAGCHFSFFFSYPTLIFYPFPFGLLFLQTHTPSFFCQMSPFFSTQSASSHSLTHLSACAPLCGSVSVQSLSFFLSLTSLCLSLFAAAWCSVKRDWAWRYPTTRQDSWSLPTSSLTTPPSLKLFSLCISPTLTLAPPLSPLSLLTFLNSFCKYMFTQCKWMVSTAVKIEQCILQCEITETRLHLTNGSLLAPDFGLFHAHVSSSSEPLVKVELVM